MYVKNIGGNGRRIMLTNKACNVLILYRYEQRELILWFFRNKPELIRDIICEECPEHIGQPGCIGSIRQPILQEDAYLIERVNAGMGEWEYVIQYCGEYYATAASEEIARDIVVRAQGKCPDCKDYQNYCENKAERKK